MNTGCNANSMKILSCLYLASRGLHIIKHIWSSQSERGFSVGSKCTGVCVLDQEHLPVINAFSLLCIIACCWKLLVTAQNVLQLSAQEPCTCIALQTQISTAKAAMQTLFGQAVHTCTGTHAFSSKGFQQGPWASPKHGNAACMLLWCFSPWVLGFVMLICHCSI